MSSIFLAACSSKPAENTASSEQASSSEKIDTSSSESSSTAEEYKLVPYNEVHEFKNAKPSDLI